MNLALLWPLFTVAFLLSVFHASGLTLYIFAALLAVSLTIMGALVRHVKTTASTRADIRDPSPIQGRSALATAGLFFLMALIAVRGDYYLFAVIALMLHTFSVFGAVPPAALIPRRRLYTARGQGVPVVFTVLALPKALEQGDSTILCAPVGPLLFHRERRPSQQEPQ